ncbi:hypothetical protein [Azospirillum doebereinerae]|uniref:Uncharacterized protein n=1 Tax=Azospirillum doebereinerae TaxID=92933 RepID=A0A3S0X126_9PROT|nr:hypothetical protein [Azospirillum doebereinerae]MCG5241448.1 hypothetical protein [Azospirillum doebereinerae]RUQ74471.1 hypothetical protein EJ913_05310 [Azospirillum doebereinerae]
MNNISQTSMVRGADGRLYAVTGRGVSEIAETGAAAAQANVRVGSRSGFDTADYEAGRMNITPGA